MRTKRDPKTSARNFLSSASQFRLGALPTEQPHPLTQGLSTLATHNLKQALKIMHGIDHNALKIVRSKIENIRTLADKINATLHTGKSIFLCGCGATGRLSIALETLWRKSYAGDSLENRVAGFMAGGDVALVRSIENIEDHPEYGKRHLRELGFTDGDLLISCTEGGETPFVIGATRYAADRSSNAPFFLYCNPDDILCSVAARSANIIHDPRINKINLFVGPMTLAGSTRMQASTVLMAAAGLALLGHADPDTIAHAVDSLISYWEKLDISFLDRFVIQEASSYLAGEYCIYQTGNDLAITILTDTTERSPTFSMHPFENTQDTDAPCSLCYLYLPEAADGVSAWKMLLGRDPRALAWKRIGPGASYQRLLGFDFSSYHIKQRITTKLPARHHYFKIQHTAKNIIFNLDDFAVHLPVNDLSPLSIHLVLKMLLNTHSTLVMGRLGRYDGNVMTWVKASNNKLVDRTIRYVDLLLQKKGVVATYEQIAYACFDLMDKVGQDESLVHSVVNTLSSTSLSYP